MSPVKEKVHSGASTCFKRQTVFILEQNNLDNGTAAWRLSSPIHWSAG